MLYIWLLLCLAILLFSQWLLITLLILEIMTFFILFFISFILSSVILRDMLILCFFRVFVIEGVIALAGLILLVRFTGSDYLRSSSVLKS